MVRTMRRSPNLLSFDKALVRVVAHGGAILLGPSGMWPVVSQDLRAYAKDNHKNLRAPHYSVSAAGLRDEIVKAGDGVLLLDDMGSFSDAALLELETDLATAASAGRPTPTVIGILLVEGRDDPDQQRRAERLASIYKIPVLELDSDGDVLSIPYEPVLKEAPYPVRQDLEYVNRHRRMLGMAPLDPEEAGWSPKDVEIEARRIRTLMNPNVKWGSPYGLPYRRSDGSLVRIYRRGQRFRFYDARGKQVGPEQATMTQAVAVAITHGWVIVDQPAPNPEHDMGEVKRLLSDEISVKAGSHRAWDKVVRALGYRPQTYYSFQRRSSAGTSFFFLPREEFAKIRKIKGVSSWRMKPGERWAKTIRFGREGNPMWKDRIPGGKADKRTPADFDPVALAEGVEVEREHAGADTALAMEIAMDHLVEDPKYYEKLRTIHTNPGDIARTKTRMLSY